MKNKKKTLQTFTERRKLQGDFLAAQWLRLHASSGGGVGSVPGWETKILHAAWYSQKKRKRSGKLEWST